MSASEKDLILARREGYKACFEEANRQISAVTFLREIDSQLKVRGGIDQWVKQKYPLPEDSIVTHCDDCDRPELCDIIKRGTAPCGRNAGMGPAAVRVVEELKEDARAVLRTSSPLPSGADMIDDMRRAFSPLPTGGAQRMADKVMRTIENDGVGEAGGLLNVPSPWPRDPRANTESSSEPLTKTREVL